MTDIKNMQVGQLVDFCITYNERVKASQKAENRAETNGNKRKGTQNDINAYFG